MDNIKYPKIKVKLTGTDGNAFAVMGKVIAALRGGGVSAEEIQHFRENATSSDYNHLLHTCMKWVSVH